MQHCLLNAFISFLDDVIKALPYPHDKHIVMDVLLGVLNTSLLQGKC